MVSDGYGHNSNVPPHPQQQEEEHQSSLPTLEILNPEASFLYMQNQPQQVQSLNQQSNLNIQPSDMAMPGIQPHNGHFLQDNRITGSSDCSTLKRTYLDGVQEQSFSKYQRTESQPGLNNGGNLLLNSQTQIPDFASNFAATTAQYDVAERYAKRVEQQLKHLTMMTQSFENRVMYQNMMLVEALIERYERREREAKQRHDEVISRFKRLEEMMAEKGGACVTKWPNEEVLALINARTRMENEFNKADGKELGGLWEKLSVEIKKLGIIKDAKKCKEKWDNITKYFIKKMKEESQGKMAMTTKKWCYMELLRDHYARKPLRVDSSVSSVDPCSTASSSHINNVDQSKVNSKKDGDDNPNA